MAMRAEEKRDSGHIRRRILGQKALGIEVFFFWEILDRLLYGEGKNYKWYRVERYKERIGLLGRNMRCKLASPRSLWTFRLTQDQALISTIVL